MPPYVKLSESTPDQLMDRMAAQGFRRHPEWCLGLQTVKNARAQIRRVTGLTNEEIEAWGRSGLTYAEFTYSAAAAADDAGVAPEKEADMASKTKTSDMTQFMTGKGKGGTVTVHGGTTTGYQRGCRCDECKAAMSTYVAARRTARKAEAEAKAAKPARRRSKKTTTV